jgi:2,3-bisphosphoglycerate-independent phosphoglycerate mutase
MKYIVIVPDGMADHPIQKLEGKTPLQAAHTPHMDALSSMGEVGSVKTVPPGLPADSAVANLSVMGYDPARYYTGRSPLEAVSMGIEMGPSDVAFRCNLVTLSEEGPYTEKTMVDYSAGEISSEEAAPLIESVQAKLGDDLRRFYPGISYRHCMIWRGGPVGLELSKPHDIQGQPISGYLPNHVRVPEIYDLMEQSVAVLSDHPVNRKRRDAGRNPANAIWLWGEGKKPALPSFLETYGKRGAVISAVDLIKGIGRCAGMDVIEVAGATGNLHTNYTGKAQAALSALRQGADLAYVHIEAPDECGHQADLAGKIRAIERIDAEVIGLITKELEGTDYRMLVLPDHPTPIALRTHTDEPVPFVIYDSTTPRKGPAQFSEEAEKSLHIEDGHTLMAHFLGADR